MESTSMSVGDANKVKLQIKKGFSTRNMGRLHQRLQSQTDKGKIALVFDKTDGRYYRTLFAKPNTEDICSHCWLYSV